MRYTQDRGFSGIVEAENQDSSLAVAKDGGEHPREDDAHASPGRIRGFGSGSASRALPSTMTEEALEF